MIKRASTSLLWGLILLIVLNGCSLFQSSTSQDRIGSPARPALAPKKPTPGKFEARVYKESSSQHLVYYLSRPGIYDPRQKYPLVLILHGSGEAIYPQRTAVKNSESLLNSLYVRVWGPGSPGHPETSIQNRWPCFVLVPQLTYPQDWVQAEPSNGFLKLSPKPTPAMRMTMEILDSLQREFPNIDSLRLYITGISSGGFGVWDAIERWPNKFAAAAPVAGGADPNQAKRLVNQAIWAFHGAQDPTISVKGEGSMIQAIEKAGGHPRYTVYANVKHSIWDRVYAPPTPQSSDQNLFSWLFAQHSPGAAGVFSALSLHREKKH